MSHFEYVSVAVALIYALVAGRLLNGLAPCLETGKRFSIQVAWIFNLLLVCVLNWWIFWSTKDVDWTSFRFLWALALPAVLLIGAGRLLGNDPSAVRSYRDHFFEHRISLFSLGVASAVLAVLSPWIFGLVPWLTRAPVHGSGAALATLSFAGLMFKSASVHAVIVILALLLAVFAFLFVTPLPAAA